MTNPFTHRPSDNEDWEDNWPSNFMAWFSDMMLPNWCKDADHWTTRLVLYFWADCSCCLFFRGITIGVAIGLIMGLATHLI